MKIKTDTCNWIYILYFYYHDKRKPMYPVLMFETNLGYFTNLNKAVNFIKSGLKNNRIGHEELKSATNKKGYVPVMFIIEKNKTNTHDHYYSRRYYDDKGKLIGETAPWEEESEPSFYGVDPDKTKFKEGDFVQFYQAWYGKEPVLEAGIVDTPPYSKAYMKKTFKVLQQCENNYYIVTAKDHAHLEECKLMPANPEMLSEKMKAKLLKNYTRIKERRAENLNL